MEVSKIVLRPTDFVAGEDDPREVLQCVYYAKGTAVATNGKILGILEADYPKEWEDKVVDDGGSVTEQNYVGYQRVIPAEGKYKMARVNVEELERVLRDALFDDALYSNPNVRYMVKFNIGSDHVSVDVNYASELLRWMVKFGGNVFEFDNSYHPLVFRHGKNILMVLPMIDEGIEPWYIREIECEKVK